jgi:hypothetical protein
LLPRDEIRATMRLLLFSSLLTISTVAAAPQKIEIESARGVTPAGVNVQPAEYRGRKALHVTESAPGREGIAVVDGVTFRNGTIEAEVAGMPGKGAAAGARGFVGIAFRVQPDAKRYEAFYLRPTNGRADDQLRRNHSTQYISEPEFPWHRLRKENPGLYESYVDLEVGAWTRVRIVVDGVKAQLFVHDAPQPALIVNDLKLGDVSGGIALWTGSGTEAWFSSLRVTPRQPSSF